MGSPNQLDDRFRTALMETIPCAVFIADGGGRIIYWNRSAEELTGYAAAEMIGRTCEPLGISESDEPDGEVIAAVCRHSGADKSTTECRIRHKDGHVVPVVRRATAVRDEAGEHLGAIVALVDVSAIKQARNEIRGLRDELARTRSFGEMVGGSPEMRKLYEAIELVAATDASVVIEGETGTGKELVARTLHARSRRGQNVFLAVNCGALAETLLDAELFGHVKGAFTGAVADRAGRFEEASGGTLLLDEVAELSPASQVKLLRVLQEGQITRVGESRPRDVDVRIIAATNRDLAAAAKAGTFRSDLYYRLRVVALHVPPLRSRREDIPELVGHFVERFNVRYGRRVEGFSAGAMDVLTRLAWPGNVRQLEHAVEHAFVVTPRDATELPAGALPDDLGRPAHRAAPAELPPGLDERQQVLAALDRAEGNKSAAARILGITRAGLYKKLRRLGLQSPPAPAGHSDEEAPSDRPPSAR